MSKNQTLCYWAFHKHANSKVQKPPSHIAFFAAVNHNYLPSPCTASSQALSVNASFGDVSETNGRETPRQSRSAHA